MFSISFFHYQYTKKFQSDMSTFIYTNSLTNTGLNRPIWSKFNNINLSTWGTFLLDLFLCFWYFEWNRRDPDNVDLNTRNLKISDFDYPGFQIDWSKPKYWALPPGLPPRPLPVTVWIVKNHDSYEAVNSFKIRYNLKSDHFSKFLVVIEVDIILRSDHFSKFEVWVDWTESQTWQVVDTSTCHPSPLEKFLQTAQVYTLLDLILIKIAILFYFMMWFLPNCKFMMLSLPNCSLQLFFFFFFLKVGGI